MALKETLRLLFERGECDTFKDDCLNDIDRLAPLPTDITLPPSADDYQTTKHLLRKVKYTEQQLKEWDYCFEQTRRLFPRLFSHSFHTDSYIIRGYEYEAQLDKDIGHFISLKTQHNSFLIHSDSRKNRSVLSMTYFPKLFVEPNCAHKFSSRIELKDIIFAENHDEHTYQPSFSLVALLRLHGLVGDTQLKERFIIKRSHELYDTISIDNEYFYLTMSHHHQKAFEPQQVVYAPNDVYCVDLENKKVPINHFIDYFLGKSNTKGRHIYISGFLGFMYTSNKYREVLRATENLTAIDPVFDDFCNDRSVEMSLTVDKKTGLTEVRYEKELVKIIKTNGENSLSKKLQSLVAQSYNSRREYLVKSYDLLKTCLAENDPYYPNLIQKQVGRNVLELLLEPKGLKDLSKSGVSPSFFNALFCNKNDMLLNALSTAMRFYKKGDTKRAIESLIHHVKLPNVIKKNILSKGYLSKSNVQRIAKMVDKFGVDNANKIVDLYFILSDNALSLDKLEFYNDLMENVFEEIEFMLDVGFSITKLTNHANKYADGWFQVYDILYLCNEITNIEPFDKTKPAAIKTVREYHDYLTNYYNNLEVKLHAAYLEPFKSEFTPQLFAITDSDDMVFYSVEPPINTAELVEVGKQMNHCVGTYLRRHHARDCEILLVKNGNKTNVCCLELRKSNDGQHYVLTQAKMRFNKPAKHDPIINQVVLKWLEQNNTSYATHDVLNNQNE